MYGLVNRAIEDLIVENHGTEVWAQICAKAGIPQEPFISMDPYSDVVTYKLVGAVSEVLDIPAEQVLEAFGRYWTLYTAEKGYGMMLDQAGSDMREFLHNLDNLHTRVGMSMPKLRPPSFECIENDDGTLRLYYRSERDGLTPMVVGLLKGLGERFGSPVEVEVVERKSEGAACDVFLVRGA